MKKVFALTLSALLAASLTFIGCSGGGDNPAVFFPPSDVAGGGAGTGDGTSGGGTSGGGSGTETGGTAISPEDKAKSDAELVKEGNAALTDGDYDKAVSKFNAAYQKNPSDQNKIYYTLTDLAMLSVDDTIVDLMKNKLGMTKYPATLNALLNTAWAKDKTQQPLGSGWTKDYPRYKMTLFSKMFKSANGSYIRVSGTPTNTYSSDTRLFSFTLYNGEWMSEYGYLANATPDANGPYLIGRDSTKDASVSADYRYSTWRDEATQNADGSYIRVSGTPTPERRRIYNCYMLVNGEWTPYSMTPEYSAGNQYLANATPDANGPYLIYRDSTTDASVSADYRYSISSYYNNGTYRYVATQNASGSHIRVSGTPIPEPRGLSGYILVNGEWTQYSNTPEYSAGNRYLANATPDANGPYLIYRDSTTDASVSADYRYNVSRVYCDSEYKAVPGTAFTLPELAVPSWVTDQNFYKSTLIGATQTMQTWGALLYANIISNNESGVNDVVDKLLPLIHKKSEEVKKTVDSLGDGTAKIEASFLATLNLKEILGEDDITIGKIEMNALAAALEGVDAVLNYAASYDLSANLKAAETDGSSYSNALKIIRNCVTAKTLAVRDAEKMTTSKTLLVDALSRLISSYEDMKVSTSYPQVAKEGIAQYGDILHDGAVKAKAAIENGSVFYIPKELTGKTFPTNLASAALGVDMGKIFTPGYWTSLVERSSDSTIKFYYQRVQRVLTINPFSDNTTESELTEIADIDAFCNTTTSDSGTTQTSVTEEGVTTLTTTTISYRVGILLNQSVLSDVFPSVENVAEKMKFVDFIGIN